MITLKADLATRRAATIVLAGRKMPSATIAGGALILFGWIAILFVSRENTFTSATIEVVPGQKVITTGPYSIVRHPIYAVLSSRIILQVLRLVV